ncbi:DMT family transporter [Lentibacillus halophilus]|uniref:DMT family transporter n=1 Tax=Lentibacillus halophilus TaxID=295065 RepID=UPI0031CF7911
MFRTYMWLTFSVSAWGSNFVFGKILVNDFSPAVLTSLRLLFIVLFLIVFVLSRQKLQKVSIRDWKWILMLGVVGVFINQLTFFKGLVTADSTSSALILATAPILTGFLGRFFERTIHITYAFWFFYCNHWYLLCSEQRRSGIPL